MTSPLVKSAEALRLLVEAEPGVAASAFTVRRAWIPTTESKDIGSGVIEVLAQGVEKEPERRSGMKTTHVLCIAVTTNGTTLTEQDAAMKIATALMDYLEHQHLAEVAIFTQMEPGPVIDADAWRLGIFRSFITLKYRWRN